MNSLRPSEALVLVDSLIEEKKADLIKYAAKSDANQFYIDKMNQEISDLTVAFNALNSIEYLDAWIECEYEMKRLKNQDKELNGFVITFMDKPTAKNYGQIKLLMP